MSHGYWFELRHSHPFADIHGYVLYHRLVYEDHYKCNIIPGIDCHHINGIKTDNRIENLNLIPHDRHMKLHAIGRKHSNDTKLKLSRLMYENPSYGMLGKKHSDDSKKSTGLGVKNAWRNGAYNKKQRSRITGRFI